MRWLLLAFLFRRHDLVLIYSATFFFFAYCLWQSGPHQPLSARPSTSWRETQLAVRRAKAKAMARPQERAPLQADHGSR